MVDKPDLKKNEEAENLIRQKFTKAESKKIFNELDRLKASAFLVEWAYHERMWRYHYEMAKHLKRKLKWVQGLHNPRGLPENKY